MDKLYKKGHINKRRFRRHAVNFQSVILSSGNSYAGSVRNVSEDGLGYSMSTFTTSLRNLLPEEIIKLIILFPSGETLNLNCEIRWTTPQCEEDTFCIGLKIIDPPVKYKEFLKSFDSSR